MTALIEETFIKNFLRNFFRNIPCRFLSTLQQNPAQLVELRCFQASRQIKKSSLSPHSPMQSVSRIEAIVCVLESWTATAGRDFISPPHHSQKQRRAFAPSFHFIKAVRSFARQVPLCITSSVCIPDRHTPTGFQQTRKSAGPGQKDADIIGCLVLVAGIQRRFQRLEALWDAFSSRTRSALTPISG